MPTLEEAVAALYSEKESSWSEAGKAAKNFLQRVVAGADPAGENGYSISEPRIKNRSRAVAKLKPRIEGMEESDLAEGVEDLISDWVGVKLTCNTTHDAELAINKLRSLCQSKGSYAFAQKDGQDDVVDYIAQPKESGYRAFHAVLVIRVPDAQGVLCDVKVEIQIKTRLQDAWGELTHDNLYKNVDGPTPTMFHTQLAKTMADLLASVDVLAQQITADIDAQPVAQPQDELVTIVRVEPKYALAQAKDEKQGLIRAFSLRDFLARQKEIEPDAYISVEDHLKLGAKLWVFREVAEDEKLYFNPTRFAQES